MLFSHRFYKVIVSIYSTLYVITCLAQSSKPINIQDFFEADCASLKGCVYRCHTTGLDHVRALQEAISEIIGIQQEGIEAMLTRDILIALSCHSLIANV